MRKVKVVGHAITLAGAVRVAGEVVEVTDDKVRIPPRDEQLRRWGHIKLVEVSPTEQVKVPESAPAPEVSETVEDAPEERKGWAAMDDQSLLEAAAGMGEQEMDDFIAWANSDEGTEAGLTVAKAMRPGI